jgi:hypothetical protein
MIEGSGSGMLKNLRTLRIRIRNTVKKVFGRSLHSGLNLLTYRAESNIEWTELTELKRRMIGGSLKSGLCPKAKDWRAAYRLNLLGSGGEGLAAASSLASDP